MSLELLTPCVCVSPAHLLLSAEGHENMELHQLSMPALSMQYQDIYWTRTKDSYSLIWQAREFELQRKRNTDLYNWKTSLAFIPFLKSPFVSLSLHFSCRKFMTYQSMKY